MTWMAPPIWTVPHEWAGERAFVICGGESVRAQRQHIPHLIGRVVAVKHAVLLRPNADVLFFAGERPEEIAPVCLKRYQGPCVVVRGRGHSAFPPSAKRIGRTVEHHTWSADPTKVAGYDAGTSAINLAMLFGATEIVLLGYDMQGGRWFNGEIQHYLPQPPESDFLRHLSPLAALASDASVKGVTIWNTSPISRAPFVYRPLEDFV